MMKRVELVPYSQSVKPVTHISRAANDSLRKKNKIGKMIICGYGNDMYRYFETRIFFSLIYLEFYKFIRCRKSLKLLKLKSNSCRLRKLFENGPFSLALP